MLYNPKYLFLASTSATKEQPNHSGGKDTIPVQSGSGASNSADSDLQVGSGLLDNVLELAGFDSHRLVQQIAEVFVKKISPALIPQPLLVCGHS